MQKNSLSESGGSLNGPNPFTELPFLFNFPTKAFIQGMPWPHSVKRRFSSLISASSPPLRSNPKSLRFEFEYKALLSNRCVSGLKSCLEGPPPPSPCALGPLPHTSLGRPEPVALHFITSQGALGGRERERVGRH